MFSLLQTKTLRTAGGLALLLVSGALAGACSNTETVATGNPLDKESGFCDALVQNECSSALVTSCYDLSSTDTSNLDADTTRCQDAASAADICNPGHLPYHAEQAQAALDTIAMIYSDGVLSKDELPTLADAMATVFNNGGAEGSKCNVVTDCDATNGLSCIQHAGKGYCGHPVLVAAGESCEKVNAACDTGYYCDAGLHCVARQDLHQTCASSDECSEGLKCSPTSGKCVALAQDGADCSLPADCANGFCLKKSAEDKLGFCASQDKFDPFSSSCDVYR
ncbi:MAG TPA: hypothetical protein VHB21_00620 [Minicystis sp.]|nr:hypothetical protein [Minicystis sp.]